MNNIKYVLILTMFAWGISISASHENTLNLNNDRIAQYFSLGDVVGAVVSGIQDVANTALNALRSALPKIQTAVAIAKAILGKQSASISKSDAQNLQNALGDANSVSDQTSSLISFPLPTLTPANIPSQDDLPTALALAKNISIYANTVLNMGPMPFTDAVKNRLINLQITSPYGWSNDDVTFLIEALIPTSGSCTGSCAYANMVYTTWSQKENNALSVSLGKWQTESQQTNLKEFFKQGQYVVQVFFDLFDSISDADKAVLQKAMQDQASVLSRVTVPST